MQSDENYKNDLDYLSKLGFETVAVTDADLADLKKKIRSRSFAWSRLYFNLGSLIIGIALGGFIFYTFYKKSSPNPIVNELKTFDKSNPKTSNRDESIISLDTVFVVKENFINPLAKNNKSEILKENTISKAKDSADVIATKPLDLSLLRNGEIREEKLKYMINSPVFYLHDMKITNYTTLYFKKNRFVKYSGVSAAYSNANENAPAGSGLKQSADYYLHDEIATAMLYFKKGKYDQAINSLNMISSYNQNDLNCDFYLAMSYYYKKNYSKAIELFDLCILNANNTFLQEAAYYKALSLYEKGNKEEARQAFKKIVEENEFYAEKAKTYLKD